MKKTISVLAVALAALGAAPEPETNESFTYNVVAVKRRLLLASTGGELELKEGDKAQSGASLRTGSRSSADLEVSERAARFHIGTKTRFHLAAGKPGVLIDVERGSLRAIFGKLPEGDQSERLVTTPSAVLAVRGTDYGVEVESEIAALVERISARTELRTAYPPRWLAIKLLEGEADLVERVAADDDGAAIFKIAEASRSRIESMHGDTADIAIADARYGYVHGVVREVVDTSAVSRYTVTDRLDQFER